MPTVGTFQRLLLIEPALLVNPHREKVRDRTVLDECLKGRLIKSRAQQCQRIRPYQVLQQRHEHRLILLPQAGNVVIAHENLQGLWIVRAIWHTPCKNLGMPKLPCRLNHAMPREKRPVLGNHHIPVDAVLGEGLLEMRNFLGGMCAIISRVWP
jgi:hypothetical protein